MIDRNIKYILMTTTYLDLRSSGTLHSADWYKSTDVSRQQVGPI